MRTVYQYIRPKLSRIGLTMVIKIGGTVIELYLPWLLSSILDDCAAVGDLQGAWLRGGLMVLCSLLALAGNAIANYMSCATSRDITRRLRSDLYHNCLLYTSPSPRD